MFSRLYLDLAEQTPVFLREDGPQDQTASSKPARINEDVVKAVWLEQPWGAHPIRDVTGRRVEILSPGWLNGGPGPDFRNAVYRIDGGPHTSGDVEIHVRSSDWTRHGHHNDPAYDNVGLHVALYLDVKGIDKRTRSGKPVVEIELAPVCLAAIDRIRAQTPPDPSTVNLTMITGRCGEALEKLGAEKTMTLIEAAGEGRCDLKSRRYAEAMRRGEGARELYEGIMEAMGYSAFKPQFLRLARLAPPEKLKATLDGVSWRDRRVVLQGTLLGMAGLLVDASISSNNDAETAGYLGGLNEAWRRAESLEFRAEMEPAEWKLAGTRPANYPTGRLAGIACFLSSHIDGDLETLFARALNGSVENGGDGAARGVMEKVERLFETPPDEYMSTHYILGGKKLAKPRKLIGAERIGVMMANVIIPYMLARARRMSSAVEEERIRKIYHGLPPSPPNSVVKFMAERLSSGAFSVKELTAKTPRQQGLIQIYNDYCLGSAKGCGECGFFKYAGRLR